MNIINALEEGKEEHRTRTRTRIKQRGTPESTPNQIGQYLEREKVHNEGDRLNILSPCSISARAYVESRLLLVRNTCSLP